MYQNKYKTNSFYLAAFLLSKGAELVGTEKSAGNKSIFVFNDTDEVKGFVGVFNFSNDDNAHLSVNFKKVEAAIKRLKSLIYD